MESDGRTPADDRRDAGSTAGPSSAGVSPVIIRPPCRPVGSKDAHYETAGLGPARLRAGSKDGAAARIGCR
jgi:hypothetical protein